MVLLVGQRAMLLFSQVRSDFCMTQTPPNQSPEPTPSGACSSAIAVHVVAAAWLSFFR